MNRRPFHAYQSIGDFITAKLLYIAAPFIIAFFLISEVNDVDLSLVLFLAACIFAFLIIVFHKISKKPVFSISKEGIKTADAFYKWDELENIKITKTTYQNRTSISFTFEYLGEEVLIDLKATTCSIGELEELLARYKVEFKKNNVVKKKKLRINIAI